MKHRILIITLLAAVLMTFVGCSTTRKTTAGTEVRQKAYKIKPVKEIVEHAIEAQPSFTTMNISKLSAQLQYNDLSITVKGSTRVIAGESVSVSIQPALGIEIYRLEFTPEGFAVYDKMNRRYARNSYEHIFLQTGVKVDYNTIESLVAHRLFVPFSKENEQLVKRFKTLKMYDALSIIAEEAFGNNGLQFDISPESYRIVRSSVVDKSEMPMVTLAYGELKSFGKVSYPSSVVLGAQFSSYDFSITFTNERIAFDKEIFTLPIDTSRYTRVSIEEIANLSSLMNKGLLNR